MTKYSVTKNLDICSGQFATTTESYRFSDGTRVNVTRDIARASGMNTIEAKLSAAELDLVRRIEATQWDCDAGIFRESENGDSVRLPVRIARTKSYLVRLGDVTPNRATVVSVQEYDTEQDAYDSAMGNYDVVTNPELVPTKGERVWIEQTGRSGGRHPITARA